MTRGWRAGTVRLRLPRFGWIVSSPLRGHRILFRIYRRSADTLDVEEDNSAHIPTLGHMYGKVIPAQRKRAALPHRLCLAALGGNHVLMRALFLVSFNLLIGYSAVAQERTRVIRTMGFETYVVVAPVADEATALPDAELHCAAYNRFANFRRMDGVTAVFDCEPRKVEKKPSGTGGGGIY